LEWFTEIMMNASRCHSLVTGRILWALRAVATIAFLICTASVLRAAPVTATWNSNPESDIAGYILSYGTQSGTYSSSIDVGNLTTWPLNLTAGQRYYFVVQAYNTGTQVGARSAEVFADIVAGPAPAIASVSPASGAVGTSVTISGANFGSTRAASTVRFNGTVATPTSWSAGSLVLPVPSGATTGAVVVTVDGVASNGVTFTVSSANQAPTLSQPANQTSAEGSTVSVQLVASDPDGTPSTYSATGLPASLSVNATTGVISGTLPFTSAGTYTTTATASDGALSNSKTFTWTVTDVSAGPSITSLSPTSGAVATSVTISGTNFGSTQGTSSVRFNGTVATPGTWSAGSLVAPVPSGATTGPVVVTVGGVASNGVTFTVSTSTALPAPWSSQDVGSPALAGQATHTAGTFSVSGAGTDIGHTTDQFRFVYRTLDGDGQIIARVGSLQNTDSWTKAAVMIREDLLGNAPNAAVAVTPGKGMIFQSRGTRGGTTRSIKGFPGVAPQWIRLVRSGNTLSGYYSANGTAWTLMGSSTTVMASRVYIGLAVTSHNPSLSASATFTNVTATGGVTASQTSSTLVTASATPTNTQSEPAAQAVAENAIVSGSPGNRSTSDYDRVARRIGGYSRRETKKHSSAA